MPINTDKYPIDFDALMKGDRLTADQLEVITGKQRGTDEYSFALLSLQSEIHERGMTCKIEEKYDLLILTDAEASRHNHRLFQRALAVTGRRFALNQHVDQANLNDDEKNRHQKNLLVESRFVQAIVRTRKEIAVGVRNGTAPNRILPPEKPNKTIEVK